MISYDVYLYLSVTSLSRIIPGTIHAAANGFI